MKDELTKSNNAESHNHTITDTATNAALSPQSAVLPTPTPNPQPPTPTNIRRMYLTCGALALLTVLAYIIFCTFATPGGFPLDDAWIHQVFARNLARYGEFSYNPGQVVAGSTSPLWTIMLVPGYFFNGEFYRWWAYVLGVLFLWLSGGEVYRLYRLLFPAASTAWAFGVALFVVCDWRLSWAGASGMETLLFTFLSLWLVRCHLDFYQRPLVNGRAIIRLYGGLGLIGGLLTLTRPEGLVLFGLVGLDVGRLVLQTPERTTTPSGETMLRRWLLLGQRWLAMGIGLSICLIPYGVFNYNASGSILPNTFSAKVGFYGSDLSISSIFGYFGRAFDSLFIQGPLLVLIPGLILILGDMFRKISKYNWLPLAWVGSLLILYALRLPVTYHNGRYLMPLIPFLALYGVRGSEMLVKTLQTRRLPKVARALPLLGWILIGYFWAIGAYTYQGQVKYINDEQVRVGQWLRDNTPPNAVVASHDIGAIGYFSQRRLVDTAGLVSPEFVKIVRNEQAILAQLKTEGVDYFAMLPTWYPDLDKQLNAENRKVFQPQETYLAQFGEQNMAVFRLK